MKITINITENEFKKAINASSFGASGINVDNLPMDKLITPTSLLLSLQGITRIFNEDDVERIIKTEL